MKKNVSKVLCRLLALIPACFAGQILFEPLLHTAYRYPAFDRACVSAADLVRLVIVVCVLLAAAALICALLKGRLDHSMGTALLLVALLTPFGVFASILSTNIHENAVYSHTEDLSDYGQWDAGVSDFEGMEVLPAREMVSDGALSYVYDEDAQGKTRQCEIKLTLFLNPEDYAAEIERLDVLEIAGAVKATESATLSFTYDCATFLWQAAVVQFDAETRCVTYQVSGFPYFPPGTIA